MVDTCLHVVKEYLLGVSLQYSQEVTNELNVGNSTLIGFGGEYNRFHYLFLCFCFVDEYLIGHLVINNCHQVDMVAFILIVPVCCQVRYSPVDIWNIAIVSAFYVDGVGDCLALYEMSDVEGILSVNPQISLLE